MAPQVSQHMPPNTYTTATVRAQAAYSANSLPPEQSYITKFSISYFNITFPNAFVASVGSLNGTQREFYHSSPTQQSPTLLQPLQTVQAGYNTSLPVLNFRPSSAILTQPCSLNGTDRVFSTIVSTTSTTATVRMTSESVCRLKRFHLPCCSQSEPCTHLVSSIGNLHYRITTTTTVTPTTYHLYTEKHQLATIQA